MIYKIGKTIMEFESEYEIFEFLIKLDFFSNTEYEFFENYNERYKALTGNNININDIDIMLDHLFESGYIEKVKRIFVYGSLRKGLYNHHLIENCLYEKNVIIPKFDMISLRSYPAAIKGNGSIIAECYYVNASTMKALDRLEGYPDYYNKTITKTNEGVEGWIYYMENCSNKPIYVKGGDWKKYLEDIEKGNNIIKLFK